MLGDLRAVVLGYGVLGVAQSATNGNADKYIGVELHGWPDSESSQVC